MNVLRGKLKRVSLCAGILACVTAALWFTGCSKQAAASNKLLNNGSVAAKPAWNWEAYPRLEKMRLATLPCQLQPKSMITVSSPLLGTLRVYVQNPQTNLPGGFVWAEFEPEIFAAEQKALEESRRKLEDREKLQWEVEVPRQKMQLERQIEEAQRQVAYLRLLSTNKELADLAFSVGASSGGPLRPDSLQKSELELHLLAQTKDFLEQTNVTALGIDLVGQRSEWERQKLDFERRLSQARFRMPFNGKLTVSLPLTEGVREYPVTVGQELAVARDLSMIRLRVPIANAAWTALPAENLTAMIRLPNGESLEAQFAFNKIERFQNREESVYYFQLPDEKADTAARLIGTDVSCELWARLDEPVRLVPKLALILQEPAAFQNNNWASGVSGLFPGARVVVEGQTDLAIVPSQALALSQAATK